MDKFIAELRDRTSARSTARRSWPRRGPTRSTRQRLLADGTAAIEELGLQRAAGRAHRGRGEHPDGPQRRRLHAVLLLPVAGARACRRPGTRTRPTARGWSGSRAPCCAEMGLDLADDVEIRCATRAPRCASWCCRERPAGTEDLSEEELAALVTRDAMVGVAEGGGAVMTATAATIDGPGGAAAGQRRAGVRRAVGEPRLRDGGRACTRRRVRAGSGSRRRCIARIRAWEDDHRPGEDWSYYRCWLQALEDVLAADGTVRPDGGRRPGRGAGRPPRRATTTPTHDHHALTATTNTWRSDTLFDHHELVVDGTCRRAAE